MRTNEKQQRPDSWRGCLYFNRLLYPRFLNLFIEWLPSIFSFDHTTGENREYRPEAEPGSFSFVRGRTRPLRVAQARRGYKNQPLARKILKS